MYVGTSTYYCYKQQSSYSLTISLKSGRGNVYYTFFLEKKCSLISLPLLEINTIAWGLGPYILTVCPSRNLIMISLLINSPRYYYSSMLGVDLSNMVDFVTKSYFDPKRQTQTPRTILTQNMIAEQPTYIPYWKYMFNSESKVNLYYSYAVAKTIWIVATP